MSAAREGVPAVSRRRVRLALRAARERSGLSQADVSKEIGWSLSKVQRIELGEVAISPTDLTAMLAIYQVSDGEQVAALVEDARVARRERYWTKPEHRDHLPSGLLQLLQLEMAAMTVSEYQSTHVPGQLQTAAVADAILAWFSHNLSDTARRVRRDVRLMRREHLIMREGAPDNRLLLDESVLRRTVGSPQITAEQFENLAEVALRPNVHIRVLPMDDGTLMGTFGPFVVLNLGQGADDEVLYRERFVHDEIIEDALEVRYHRDLFERFWSRALDEEASRNLILARVFDLKARVAQEISQNQGADS
jgi:transcriptional regulator with XRE-family HTH domain